MKILQFFLIQLFGLILVIPTVVPSSTDDIVPVLLWGGDGPGELHSNPFEKISQSHLEEVLNKKLGKSQPPVLVFVKDQFCIEDLKQHSESLGQLKGYGSIHYIPGVPSPVSTFKMLPNYNQSMEEKFESISDGQIVVTEINDLDSIPEIFDFSKKSSPNLVGALTGNDCVYRSNRGKREVDTDPNNKEFLIYTPKLLLYADSAPVLKINNSIHEAINLADYKYNATDKGNGTNESPLFVTVEFNSMNESLPSSIIFDIEIIFHNSGYYSLRKINMSIDSKHDATLEIRPEIYWASGFSYHCAQKTIFHNTALDANLTFENLQLQIGTDKFGDTYDCIGFTSEPIWSSMFVTALVILITLWGILMIMDIRTMERFDDPKGKTISVTATE